MSGELVTPPKEAPTSVGHGALGRRNDRLLLVLVGGYIALLSALMIVRGVSITPDVLLVALGLAAVMLGRGRLFLRDWVPFIGLFFAYELMRGYADNLGLAVHVGDVVAIERALFLGNVPTAALQAWLHPATGSDVVAIERAMFLGNVPTAVLQAWLHPATGIDVLAVVGTIFYFLHFPLPIAVGFFLWLKRRRLYYDYVAALIVLSMAGFVTYLLLPVAPPWYAAREGLLPGVTYLKDQGFTDLARLFGFEGHYLFSYTVYQFNPNQVAAFPSLHAGYPFLAFLFARRAFGRVGWLMLVYSACVWFAVVYLADHYVVDILGGLAYASVAYWIVIHGPRRFRQLIDRAADPELESGADATGGGEDAAPGALARRIRWTVVGQGLILAGIGALVGFAMANFGLFGGSGSVLFLAPWFAVLGGLSRAAVGFLSR